jgi:HAD superfamily hydrolase (TIGR01509 family)
MHSTDLIIFDCDGVLIDSESLVCGLVSEELIALGYAISRDDVIERFAGRPQREMVADIEADWGKALPETFFSRCKQRTVEAYRTDLQAIPGALVMLEQAGVRTCVASSSYPEKLRLGLETTGLYDRLAPNVISASFVAQGKPAPDVFIYAAGWMRTPVDRCVVVEDSIPGVRAGRSAGMTVFGFTGGSHCRPGHEDRLIEAGAHSVFNDMSELPRLIPEAFRDAKPRIVGRGTRGRGFPSATAA